jgi:hypothetical protein
MSFIVLLQFVMEYVQFASKKFADYLLLIIRKTAHIKESFRT